MKKLQQQRGWAKAHITRTVEVAEKLSDSDSVEQCSNRLQKLEENYKDLVALSQELYSFEDDPKFVDPIDDIVEYETRYFQAHAIMLRWLDSKRPAQNTPEDHSATLKCDKEDTLQKLAEQQSSFLESFTAANNVSRIQLPHIKIAVFTGRYQDWTSFKDLFSSAVGSKQGLTSTQKFFYLTSFLEGDALNLVQHIPITEQNYAEAWDRLVQRYERKSLIVRSFVQSFLSLPSCNSSSAAVLRKLTDGADEVVRGLNALNSNSRDPWLIQILLNKLDNESKHEWAKHCDVQIEPTFATFLTFLTNRCDALESCVNSNSRHSNGRRAVTNFWNAEEKPVAKCPNCNDAHTLSQCRQFKQLSDVARRSFVKERKLCFNCFSRAHIVSKCPSQYRCKLCSAKHHTLVHTNYASPSTNTNTFSSGQSSGNQRVSTPVQSGDHTQISPTALTAISDNIRVASMHTHTLLPTARAVVIDKWGKKVNCRLMLDTGSTVSFVAEAFVQRCGLPRSNARIPVTGLSSCKAGVTRGRVQLSLHSLVSSDSVHMSALILPKLTAAIPTQSVTFPFPAWNEILQLPLADTSFTTSGAIDVLVGSDYFWNICTGEQKQFGIGLPIAIKSVFGWVVSGSYTAVGETSMLAATHHAALDNLDSLFRIFMEMEGVKSTEIKIMMADPAESHFATTHTRATDGTYIVKYPFKEKAPLVAETLSQALSRFQHMERKFRSNVELKQQYVDFMREYLALGHMQRIPQHEVNINNAEYFYLPHHAVLKPDSKTTKCRVVFDGSSKDSSGVSLNDRLHIGPPIQRNLFGVLIRFRQHRYVFSADIEKMFRGIRVSPEHTDFQRIVWRENEECPIEHYRLLTVTYGLASSPFLAVRVLNQLSRDYKQIYPTASSVLENDAYVDDITAGADSVEELIAIRTQLIALLEKANFKLQKWCSNCWPFLETCEKHLREFNPMEFESVNSNSCVKLLGLQWRPCVDEFCLKIKAFGAREPMKRIVLSETAKIYDPLGIVAPTVVLFKMLLQDLWLRGLKWDDPLPDELCDRWYKYVDEMPCLATVRIPRSIVSPTAGNIELHGFADASSLAYAAVVYSRTQVGDNYSITLISAKTRVSPLKPVSIPRLELSAAYLLTKLISAIKSSLTVSISNVFCWSDSEIVLHWLSSPPRRWNSFVCNRTADILDVCPRSQWQHVSSEDNPADCASRGMLPSTLVEHRLWWQGPPWLALSEEQWPKSKFSRIQDNDSIVLSEKRKTKPVVLCATDTDNTIEALISKSSSWTRLIRIVAYCVRFGTLCRRAHMPFDSTLHSINTFELQQSTAIILRHVQQLAFGTEVKQLTNQKQLHAKSSLIRYSPFLDDVGLLRIGGRLKHSALSFTVKHPILLPKTSEISLLIIRYLHIKHLHTGVEATFAIVRQQFWILGCRNLVRKVVFSCKPCFLQRRATSTQLMGNLPAPRLQQHGRCFLHCGLDYAGPVPIKLSKTRNARIGKAWFSICVCLSTKAIHLELVSDLTSEAFLAAFRRFVARRGKPSDLYSDNGTTFHGARRVLDELRKLTMSETYMEEVSTSLAMDGIQWHFIPPSAPHFGGLWESGVRSIKLHLRRVIGSAVLTFEDYSTVLAQVEAILNSRPLCAISDTELDPLTPAHFLIGEPYTSIPEPSVLDIKANRLDHWRHLQAMVQGFWKRWHSEYLTTLQQRNKWHHRQPNIEAGAIVVLKEPNLPPSKWMIGKITSVIRGDDNLVRVVNVKTSRGEYTRPVAKIAVLPNS